MDEGESAEPELDEAAGSARPNSYEFKIRALADMAPNNPEGVNLVLDAWAQQIAREERLGPVRSATPAPRLITPPPEPRVGVPPQGKDQSCTSEEASSASVSEGGAADQPDEEEQPSRGVSVIREARAARLTKHQ